jgi:mono/diheme cytochrome c family protein
MTALLFGEEVMMSVRMSNVSSIIVGMSFVVSLWFPVASGHAQQQDVTTAGKLEYQKSCAVCHGRDGKGKGAMAKLLKVKPANLTLLSAKHDGFYPFWEVYRVIDGRKEIGGHGSGDMPIWGTVFKQQGGSDRGADLAAYARILEIVYYLESIQAPQRRKP